MREIPIHTPRHPDAVLLVDDEDFDRVSQFRWTPSKAKNTVYAVTKVEGVLIRAHRFILGAAAIGFDVDHKDRDGLNNQKDNLRVCSKSENARNAVKRPHWKHSRYKGVSWDAGAKNWFAAITTMGNKTYLGHFHSETDAALAYNVAAAREHGEFAVLNDVGVGHDADVRTRKLIKPIGSACQWSKLTEEYVKIIRASTESQRTLGKRFGVSQSLISMVQRRKVWGHVL